MPQSALARKIGEFATDRLGRKLSENRLIRRAKIMQATLNLIASRGYDAVTVEELAAASEVSKKTLYDIYGSKQAVVAQAVALRLDTVTDQIERDLPQDGLERLRSIVRQTCAAVLDTPQLSRALAPMLVGSAQEFHLTAFFERLHRNALDTMKRERLLHSWVDIEFTARSMMFDQVSVQNLWAGMNIADGEYEDFAMLDTYRVLTPLAKVSLRKDLVEEVRLLQNRLRDRGS